MDRKTLKALRGSIKKWECICMGMKKDKGGDCPLCKLFWPNCKSGCPVAAVSRRSACGGTPYHDFEGDFCSASNADAALAMLEFLEEIERRATEGKG